MDLSLAKKMCQLNNDFYRDQAVSFSDTRHAKWPGWECCLKAVSSVFLDQSNSVLLDVACGNLRFEKFLASQLLERQIQVWALDSCDELLPQTCAGTLVEKVNADTLSKEERAHIAEKTCAVDVTAAPGKADGADTPGVKGAAAAPEKAGVADSVENAGAAGAHLQINYLHCDVMEAIGSSKAFTYGIPQADISVSFGFMHHVPLPEWRVQLLNSLIEATKPGGFVCVSFWEFLADEGLAAKAYKTHERALAELGPAWGFSSVDFNDGDFLLGWRNTPGAYRYCHSFSTSEVDALIATVSSRAECVARFRADGRTETLNEYIVLRVIE